MECELERIIRAAMEAAGAVRSQVFENKELSRSAKMLVYNQIVVATDTDVWSRILNVQGN